MNTETKNSPSPIEQCINVAEATDVLSCTVMLAKKEHAALVAVAEAAELLQKACDDESIAMNRSVAKNNAIAKVSWRKLELRSALSNLSTIRKA